MKGGNNRPAVTFNVYVSHNTSPWELAQVYALANEAQRQGLAIFIPDRTWNPPAPLPDHIGAALSKADLVILFATINGRYLDWVNSELSAVHGKPLLAIVEPGVQLSGIAGEDIVPLQRNNLAESTSQALKRLESLKLNQDVSNFIAGFLTMTLALLILRAATKKS